MRRSDAGHAGRWDIPVEPDGHQRHGNPRWHFGGVEKIIVKAEKPVGRVVIGALIFPLIGGHVAVP